MIKIVCVALISVWVTSCSGSTSSHVSLDAGIGSSSGPGAPLSSSARTLLASKGNPYVARAMPARTFDMLTPPIAPGDRVMTAANLPNGWRVIGRPILVADPVTGAPSTFVVDQAVTLNSMYRLTARNVGRVPARLVADVPYAVIPSTP